MLIFDFLHPVPNKYGIGFGTSLALFIKLYQKTMLSRQNDKIEQILATVNAGLGMLAIGVGVEADAVDVMSECLKIKVPLLIELELIKT